MAAGAIRGSTGELGGAFTHMALGAISVPMGPRQGEEAAVVALLHAGAIQPAIRRVALRASVAQTALMRIQMALGTGGWRVLEAQFHMASRATHNLMDAFQRPMAITAVLEVRRVLQAPSAGGVAGGAIQLKGAVGAGGFLPGPGRKAQHQQDQAYEAAHVSLPWVFVVLRGNPRSGCPGLCIG